MKFPADELTYVDIQGQRSSRRALFTHLIHSTIESILFNNPIIIYTTIGLKLDSSS